MKILLLALALVSTSALADSTALTCRGKRKDGSRIRVGLNGTSLVVVDGRVYLTVEKSRHTDGSVLESDDHHGLRVRLARGNDKIKGEDKRGKFKAKCREDRGAPSDVDSADDDVSEGDGDGYSFDSPFSS